MDRNSDPDAPHPSSGNDAPDGTEPALYCDACQHEVASEAHACAHCGISFDGAGYFHRLAAEPPSDDFAFLFPGSATKGRQTIRHR